jgi:hypothetical protein
MLKATAESPVAFRDPFATGLLLPVASDARYAVDAPGRPGSRIVTTSRIVLGVNDIAR